MQVGASVTARMSTVTSTETFDADTYTPFLLESTGALRRRFARLEDVQAVWTPKPARTPEPTQKAGSVFGHLHPAAKHGPVKTGATVTMTWEKFARTLLPTAESIYLLVPHGRASFSALVTACDPAAPPILQWDREDERNPVSGYVYSHGSSASQWELTAGAWAKVTAITLRPSQWSAKPLEHQGKGIHLLLERCRDTREGGLALFPEILRSEYHEIRRTIEAYSQAGKLEGREEATACGLSLSGGGAWNTTLRVTSAGIVTTVHLDRLD